MNWLVCFTLLLTTFVDFNCAAVNFQDTNSVLTFLNSLGHLKLEKNQTIQNLIGKEAILKKSILSYQKFHRLNKTGILDEQTKKLMNKPRCGLPDYSEVSFIREKWNKTDLTYSILNGYRNLNVNSIIKKAFSIWSKASTLNFRPQAGESGDIKIEFGSGDHGDGFPFDGKNGVLAHAWFPTDGRIHFDSDEHFTENTPEGYNLLMVAVHEIGHALGLDHSRNPRSIMFSPLIDYVPNFKLRNYDLKLISNIYGARTSTQSKIKPSDPKKIGKKRNQKNSGLDPNYPDRGYSQLTTGSTTTTKMTTNSKIITTILTTKISSAPEWRIVLPQFSKFYENYNKIEKEIEIQSNKIKNNNDNWINQVKNSDSII